MRRWDITVIKQNEKEFIVCLNGFRNSNVYSLRQRQKQCRDPQANQHEYLRLSDLTPLHLISISQAEAKLKEMGYGNKEKDEELYIYTSSDNKERILCALNEDNLIEVIGYVASKGISPSDAKAWLSHIPANVSLPKYARSIPFDVAEYYDSPKEDPKLTEEPKFVAKTYQQYINLLEELHSGMRVAASWEEEDIPETETVGYGVQMAYSYGDYVDQAILSITCHRKYVVEPPMAE